MMSEETECEKVLVQANGQLVELQFKPDGKVVAKRASDDTLLEATMLTDGGLDAALDNQLNAMVRNCFNQIQDDFKQGMKKAVLAALGFRCDSWSKWEVDRSNGGTSLVANLLTEEVQTMFLAEVEPFVQQNAAELAKEVQASIAKDMKEQFHRYARDFARSAAETQARTFVQELVKEQFDSMKKAAVGTILDELRNPSRQRW